MLSLDYIVCVNLRLKEKFFTLLNTVSYSNRIKKERIEGSGIREKAFYTSIKRREAKVEI